MSKPDISPKTERDGRFYKACIHVAGKKNKSERAFSIEFFGNDQKLNKIKKGIQSASHEDIEDIKLRYNISINWIYFAQGEIEEVEPSNITNDGANDFEMYKLRSENKNLTEKLKAKEETIEALKIALASKDKTIADKEEKIAELSGKVKHQKRAS